jgi:hypothetical protein
VEGAEAALDAVRALVAELPEVEERPSPGGPAWFVAGKKQLGMFLDDHHGDGRLALWLAAPAGAQEALVAADPDAYFRPPYVGHRGWIGVRLDRGLPLEAVGAHLEEAWRVVAPKRLLGS